MDKITAAITAVGGYVPEDLLTNRELEEMAQVSDEWIVSRSGIRERRILKGEGKATSDICVPVALEICRKRGISPDAIEALIVATITPDMPMPCTANIVTDKIGARNAWGIDVNAACAGFLYAMDIGARFIESGRYRNVMVIGADKMSAVIDYTDKTTCSIFGDGGGGVLLEPNHEGYGVLDSILQTDGSGARYLYIKAGGSALPANAATVGERAHYVYMNGGPIYKQAVHSLEKVARELMDRNGLTVQDISWLVPHQANKRIVDAVSRQLGIATEKVMLNVDRYGNTTAGTIPLCMWDYEHQLRKNDKLVLATFGAGFMWGSSYIRWAYDGDAVTAPGSRHQ
ncbi:beta-ketoacyl-ACP synthase III [Chitinophaga japonensis]|uniref:Beta-ketoacyl-[acyl-carrier-protein] synthase III n=1 Tax=Chitinophaga japonensis TaxID=104662 RepID=A0A562SZI1_CHIJA|nr:beta-ketoacyl-ACP synthase III [Chitinophaga japonensis]TWI86697.1 3-oxoacyl-[acyl-carrier-protein] synthase-3 [Chitinophaga japonensis]